MAVLKDLLAYEQTDSGSMTGDGRDVNVVRSYKIPNSVITSNAFLLSYIPDKNAQMDDGYFLDWDSKRGPGFTILTLKFTKYKRGGIITRENNEIESRFSSAAQEIQLEKHPDYRTKWNYKLLASADAPATPAFWDTDKTSKVDPSYSMYFQWAKSITEAPDTTWTLRESETKPGVEGWAHSCPVVVERNFYRKESSANAAILLVDKLIAPDNTHGYSSTATKWRLMDCEKDYDGKYWVVTNQYQYIDWGWDTDLYST